MSFSLKQVSLLHWQIVKLVLRKKTHLILKIKQYLLRNPKYSSQKQHKTSKKIIFVCFISSSISKCSLDFSAHDPFKHIYIKFSHLADTLIQSDFQHVSWTLLQKKSKASNSWLTLHFWLHEEWETKAQAWLKHTGVNLQSMCFYSRQLRDTLVVYEGWVSETESVNILQHIHIL